MVKETQTSSPIKSISPRISVMRGMQEKNIKDIKRRSSAFTLEYRQLRTEADEHVLKTFLTKIKNFLLPKGNKVAATNKQLDQVKEEEKEDIPPARRGRPRSSFFVQDDLLSDKLDKPTFMINPIGHTKMAWDALVMFFVIWNCCSVPYHTALQPRYNCTKEELRNVEYTDCYPQTSQNFDVIVYIVFWLDLMVQSRTGYVNDQQHIIMVAKRAFKHYLFGWFWVDFLAAIPFDYIAAAGTDTGFIEIRLMQMMKLFKIAPLTKGLDKTPYANIFRLIRVIHGLMMLGHWIGCMYFYLGMHQLNHYENEGCNDNTGCPWIKQYNMTTANLYTQYSSSLYWGMTMLTSVEFGYVSPHTNVEKFFAWFCQLLGAIITAIIFGEVVAAVQDFEGSNSRYRNVMGRTNQFLNFYNLPKDLAKRVRNNMEYGWTLHSGMDQHELLIMLPDSLRTEVLMHVQRNVIQTCTMFKECDKAFIKAMCLNLEPNAYLPYEVVYEEGDATRDVFFVSRGRFKVITGTGRALCVLSEGDYFGELSYFDYTRRSASVVAITYAEVYIITAVKLDEILERFPEYVSVLRREAAQHARVYDKGTFFASSGVRRKSALNNAPGKAPVSTMDSEKKSTITPWLDSPGGSGGKLALGGIAEDEELTEDELSLTPLDPVGPEDYADEEVSLPGSIGGGGGGGSAFSMPALSAPKASGSQLTDLEIQHRTVTMYCSQLKKMYEQALHQEKILAGHMVNVKQRAQELARKSEDDE